ncbi:MAG: hypothetical protein HW416_2828 [Chloroflexi bacterium]|nr:hypothetical protein [Chloroflexota bacterium]
MKDQAVQSYIDAIPESHRPLFDRLQSFILELYQDAEIAISYGIPTYKVGRSRVYLGLWKSGVSLHAVDAETFKQQHPSIKTGRGSLNFKLTDQLPEADIRDVIKRAISRS